MSDAVVGTEDEIIIKTQISSFPEVHILMEEDIN